MRDPDADAPEEVTWAGRFIVAKKRGRWEYVSRARNIRAAVILPLDEGHVILVEQYRVPLGKQSLELPAGLIGDDESDAGEPVLGAARRELEEETGYCAENWENLGEFYSSPGMVSESFSLLKATGLTKVGAGGGTGHENIAVHRVKLADLESFIAECRARGVGIDVRLLMLLGSSILAGCAMDRAGELLAALPDGVPANRSSAKAALLIAERVVALPRGEAPPVIGINGAQGSGKSTLAKLAAQALREFHGLSPALLSLDDFYLGKAARQELAHKAHALFESQPPKEKRRLLNFVLSNSTWKDGELSTTFRQPFDLIAKTTMAIVSSSGEKGLNSPEHPGWLGN